MLINRSTMIMGFGVVMATCSPMTTVAQIIPTDNWSSENSRLNLAGTVNGQPAITIEGGAQRGGNLFHSFQRFNIDTRQRVYFSNPSSISNIFSRITGGQPSNISGTLGVDGAANLFLLNPQGIIFGANAQLDIRGSLITTTANAIQFGSQGEFPIAPSTAPPLLNISPSALIFTANQGGIIAQGSNLSLGQGLMFLGSEVQITRSRITVPGGRMELSGIQGNGSLQLQSSDGGFEIQSTQGTLANVQLDEQSEINVRANGGGAVRIQANNFTINNSAILAGITTNTESRPSPPQDPEIPSRPDRPSQGDRPPALPIPDDAPTSANRDAIRLQETMPANRTGDSLASPSQGGDIIITAQADVALESRSVINNSVLPNARGTTGITSINARNIILSDASQILTELQGEGNLGNVLLNSQENTIFRSRQINLDSSRSSIVRRIGETGNGNIGQTTLIAKNLSLLGRASLSLQNLGQGNIDDVSIQAREDITISALQQDNSLTAGSIELVVEPSAQGDLGDLSISAQNLLMSQGGVIQSNNNGQGRVGSVFINLADQLRLDKEAGIFTGSFSFTSRDGSGEIKISANDISITNGSIINSSKVIGSGVSGNLTLLARGSFVIADTSSSGTPSGIASFFVGAGDIPELNTPGLKGAGDIQIQAKTLSILNGALVNTDLINVDGKAGRISVQASEQVRIAGVATGLDTRLLFTGRAQDANSTNLLRASLSASTVGITSSPGGTIDITTPRLIVEQDGVIDAITLSQGAGGNINIDSPEITLNSGGQILTSAFDRGAAGNVSVNARSVQISGKSRTRDVASDNIPNSGILASTSPTAEGRGGSTQINTQSLIVENDGRVSVSSQGQGIGGELKVTADSLILRNAGALLAETRSNTGGNILLNLSNLLLLRGGANISTTAGTAQLGGDGGRIDIQAPFIVSVPGENNDIVANAFSGSGGQVNITAFNLLGIAPKTRIELEQLLNVSDPARLNPSLLPSNDITAISQASPNLSGDVTVSQLDVDPTQAAARLPDDLLDRSNLINQSLCRVTNGSQFVLTGRGGLPTAATGRLTPAPLWEDLRTGMGLAYAQNQLKSALRPSDLNQSSLTEAQGWYRTQSGQIRLTNHSTIAKSTWVNRHLCRN